MFVSNDSVLNGLLQIGPLRKLTYKKVFTDCRPVRHKARHWFRESGKKKKLNLMQKIKILFLNFCLYLILKKFHLYNTRQCQDFVCIYELCYT